MPENRVTPASCLVNDLEKPRRWPRLGRLSPPDRGERTRAAAAEIVAELRADNPLLGMEPSAMTEYLFAYGTLQPGHAPAEVAPAVGKMLPIGSGCVPGLLYDLGDYPGAILDRMSERKICGTVFELPADANILRQLDDYEGFDPQAPDRSLFIRTLHPVVLANGGTLSCWVYVYNRDPESARILEGGGYTKKTR